MRFYGTILLRFDTEYLIWPTSKKYQDHYAFVRLTRHLSGRVACFGELKIQALVNTTFPDALNILCCNASNEIIL